jgi:predicted nuclease of predicted toxin-antitoxin system
MKLLFDENLSAELCSQLADLFPNSSQVRLAGLIRANDAVIREYAKAEGFVIVSLDADFADMAALFGSPPKIIWLRCGNQPTSVIESLLRDHAEAIASFEQDSANCLEIYSEQLR